MKEDLNENQVLYVSSICDNIIYCKYQHLLKEIIRFIKTVKIKINNKDYCSKLYIMVIKGDITRMNESFDKIKRLQLSNSAKKDLLFCITEIREFLEACLIITMF